MKVSELWQYLGSVFENPNDLKGYNYNKHEDETTEFTLLEKGTYIIVNKDSHGYQLYDIDKGKNVFFEAGWIEDEVPEPEFKIIHIPATEALELLIESLTKTIITLTAEGWSENPDNKYFDLTPEVTRLKTIQDILNSLKNEEN